MKTILLVLFVCIAAGLFAEATITVTYTGFTTEQQAAFEAGVALWEPILDSTIPIKINARFAPLTGFTLVTVPNMIRNFTGAPLADVWYPTSLANALTGTELNPGEADVDFFINSNDNFYFGVDGNCPVSSMEFMTEIFKAVPYGLGYMTSFYISTGYGSYGMLNPAVLGLTTSFPWEAMQNQPAIYDKFVCNTDGQLLTDTSLFTNPSPGLAAQLTGGNLRYNGELGIAYNGDEQPVLYAGAFNLARTARLNPATYAGTENAAGSPTAVNGLVLRSPSPIVMGMLQDMGWDLTMSSLRTPPSNLVADVSGANVHLNWDIPVTDYDILNYVVFRDDALLNTADEESYIDYDLAPGTYSYAVRARYSFGISGLSNVVTAEVTVGNSDDIVSPAHQWSVQISPNPFRTEARIDFKLDSVQNLSLDVFDVKGKLIHSENMGTLQPGNHTSGLNKLVCDKSIPSGIYFFRLSTEDHSEVRKALLMR